MIGKDLRFNWEWEAAPSVRAPELRATWARIEIQVGAEWVTLVEDRESGSSRRSIYCPLYPIAEWIAFNWWFLQTDARPSGFLSQDRSQVNPAFHVLPAAIRERHSVRASGDGFAWPDLLIVPDGDQTRFAWESDRQAISNRPVRFMGRGDAWVGGDIVRHQLGALVNSVLTRLSEQGISGTALAREWEAIQQTSQDEADYCRAAARLGLDPYGDAEVYEDQIIEAAGTLSDNLLEDFFDAVDPDRMKTALDWLSRARRTIERSARRLETAQPEIPLAAKAEMTLEGASDNVAPWDVGYHQARSIRDQIAPDKTLPFDVERYVETTTRQGGDLSLQAVGRGASLGSPFVVLGRSGLPTSKRFTLSRALWHSIWDSSPTFVVSSAHTYRQRVERAFAAELLAPADGIAEILESSPAAATQDELEKVARHFGVSSMVIDHQVRNRLLAVA